MSDTVKHENVSKRVTVATTIDGDTFAKFDQIAWERKHRRNSDALREAIDDWIVKHGSVGDDATSIVAS